MALALYIGSELAFQPKEADESASTTRPSTSTGELRPEGPDPGLYSKFVIGRAAVLAKADLTSGMVGEFPTSRG
jgi:hypothetical protein